MGIDVGPIEVTDGLVFHIDAGNTRSYSGSGITLNGLIGGINGTLVNGTGFGSTNGGYFTFDGSNDYIDCGYSSLINNATQMTIECWYKSSNIGVEGILFNTNSVSLTNPVNGYHLEIYQSKILLQVFPSGSYTQSTTTLSSNNWYQLVSTYNSGAVNYYVNGQSAGTASYTFTSSTANLILGRYPNGLYSLNGQLANVKFYNRALSVTEILQNYNATKGRYK